MLQALIQYICLQFKRHCNPPTLSDVLTLCRSHTAHCSTPLQAFRDLMRETTYVQRTQAKDDSIAYLPAQLLADPVLPYILLYGIIPGERQEAQSLLV